MWVFVTAPLPFFPLLHTWHCVNQSFVRCVLEVKLHDLTTEESTGARYHRPVFIVGTKSDLRDRPNCEVPTGAHSSFLLRYHCSFNMCVLLTAPKSLTLPLAVYFNTYNDTLLAAAYVSKEVNILCLRTTLAAMYAFWVTCSVNVSIWLQQWTVEVRFPLESCILNYFYVEPWQLKP